MGQRFLTKLSLPHFSQPLGEFVYGGVSEEMVLGVSFIFFYVELGDSSVSVGREPGKEKGN